MSFFPFSSLQKTRVWLIRGLFMAGLLLAFSVGGVGCRFNLFGDMGGEDAPPATFADTGYYISGKLMVPRVTFEEAEPGQSTNLIVRPNIPPLVADINAYDLVPGANMEVSLEMFPEIKTLTASDGSYRLGPIPAEAEEDLSDLYGDEYGIDLAGGNIGEASAAAKIIDAVGRTFGISPAIRAGFFSKLASGFKKLTNAVVNTVVKPAIKIVAKVGDAVAKAGTSLLGKVGINFTIPGPTAIYNKVQEVVKTVTDAVQGNVDVSLELGLPSLGSASDLFKSLGDMNVAPIVCQPMNRKARGKIIDENDQPIRNLELKLSGVVFRTDNNGEFTTADQPSGTKNQIYITSGRYTQKLPPIDFSFPAKEQPFFLYKVYPFDWADKPPFVFLSAPKYTVVAGEKIKLVATAKDPEKQGMKYSWTTTSGQGQANGLEYTFTAPSQEGIATISFEATDPGQNKGVARLPLYVVSSNGQISLPDSGNLIVLSNSGLSPANSSTNVARTSPLVMVFNKDVSPRGKSIVLRDYSTNVVLETISAIDTTKVIVNGSMVTFKPAYLKAGTRMYVAIEQGAFADSTGKNLFAGIIDKNVWSFTAADILASLSPAAGSLNVSVGQVFTATFKENIVKGTGAISIRKASDDSVLESIPISDAKIVVNGKNLQIAHAALPASTLLYVHVPSESIKDSAGKEFGGITDKSWKFTTAALAPVNFGPSTPVVPISGATNVSIKTSLTVDFPRNVIALAGNVTIKKYSDGSIVQTIAANDTAKVTVTGARAVIAIAELPGSTQYYVSMGTDCFKDSSGNLFEGIASKDAWSFTVQPVGAMSGKLTDAQNNAGIPACQLDVRSGNDVKTGPIVKSGVTDGSGNFTITNLPPDDYCVLATKTGYEDFSFNVKVEANVTKANQGAIMSKTLAAGTFRVVLKWTSGTDYDFYCTGPDGASGRFKVGYNLPAGSPKTYIDPAAPSQMVEVVLDRDALAFSSSPETFSVNKFARAGAYRFYVHAYDAGLNFAQVTATLYTPGGGVTSFNAPTATSGERYWEIFTIDETETVSTINAIRAGEPL